MEIDCSSLPDSKDEAIGFGGIFRPKIINTLVTLTFKSGKDEYKYRYSSGFRVNCIPLTLTRTEREKALKYTPNVLGMDILSKFKTYVDKRKVELVYIEK